MAAASKTERPPDLRDTARVMLEQGLSCTSDVTLMPHIPAKATASDPFLLPRDSEGKPALFAIAVQHRFAAVNFDAPCRLARCLLRSPGIPRSLAVCVPLCP